MKLMRLANALKDRSSDQQGLINFLFSCQRYEIVIYMYIYYGKHVIQYYNNSIKLNSWVPTNSNDQKLTKEISESMAMVHGLQRLGHITRKNFSSAAFANTTVFVIGDGNNPKPYLTLTLTLIITLSLTLTLTRTLTQILVLIYYHILSFIIITFYYYFYYYSHYYFHYYSYYYYCLYDNALPGKQPFTATILSLFFPSSWKFLSVDPLMVPYVTLYCSVMSYYSVLCNVMLSYLILRLIFIHGILLCYVMLSFS